MNTDIYISGNVICERCHAGVKSFLEPLLNKAAVDLLESKKVLDRGMEAYMDARRHLTHSMIFSGLSCIGWILFAVLNR